MLTIEQISYMYKTCKKQWQVIIEELYKTKGSSGVGGESWQKKFNHLGISVQEIKEATIAIPKENKLQVSPEKLNYHKCL